MENKMKRPLNAYMLFSGEQRPEIIQQKPELKSKVAEVSKLIASQWKALSTDEKAKYQERARTDREKFKKEMQTKA